jgi:hypothetical protein
MKMGWRVRVEGSLGESEVHVDDPTKMAGIVRDLEAGTGRKVIILNADGERVDRTAFPGLESGK